MNEETFGSRLSYFRNQKGLKQIQLAKLSDISPTALNYYEKDKREPNVMTIKRLAIALEVTGDDLLGLGGYGKSIETDFTLSEQEHIKKYRVLDQHGKDMVDSVLAKEHERIQHLEKERLEQERLKKALEEKERLLKKRLIQGYKVEQTVKKITPDVQPDYEEESGMVGMTIYREPAVVGCGNYLSDDTYNYEVIDFPEGEVPYGADYGVYISGDSMEPYIKDGSIAWVKAQPAVESGEVGIFIKNGEALCKELSIEYENGRKYAYLISYNEKYDSILIGEIDEVETKGKVLF